VYKSFREKKHDIVMYRPGFDAVSPVITVFITRDMVLLYLHHRRRAQEIRNAP